MTARKETLTEGEICASVEEKVALLHSKVRRYGYFEVTLELNYLEVAWLASRLRMGGK